jgi:hypothetical protein
MAVGWAEGFTSPGFLKEAECQEGESLEAEGEGEWSLLARSFFIFRILFVFLFESRCYFSGEIGTLSYSMVC